jgi:hypothetical protein
MSSQALMDFNKRLEEVKQLLDAHTALTMLRNAQAAFLQKTQSMQAIAEVVQKLVSTPGRGRSREVHALNSAGIALLSAHFQGFIVDLFKESAAKTLSGKVKDISILVESADTRGNPNQQNINNLFGSIGFPKIINGISWRAMSNSQLKTKLRLFNELRNRIVHGSTERVIKRALKNYYEVLSKLASKLDEKLRDEISSLTGSNPW